MDQTPTVEKKKVVKKAVVKTDDTDARISKIESSIETIAEMLLEMKKAPAVAPTVAETALEKEVAKASADEYMPVKREWDDRAHEIVGEAVERTSMFYPKSGGVIFELYIKNEFSNAGKDYLAFYKVDKRSKDIGNEGINGVEQFCKLVAANLSRKRATN